MPDSSNPANLVEMSPARWRKVSEVFEAAVAVAPDSRAAFLEQACGSDADLRGQVQRLLENDSRGAGFLSRPPLEGVLRSEASESLRVTDTAGQSAGRRVGVYQLVRQIGSGGMGAVWLADRADEQFQKQVAVKLIKRGMDTDEVLRRFRAERQVLARLEHPHIARLLDGGATDDGLPYLVMEYIEGVPLTAYCDGRKLPIRRRLELFRTACSAVQYAHQNLVVHRDLKPSNILVTADGTVKLLDFGIAKVLAADEGAAATQTLQRPMTPEYASPEQVRGEPITTATDVYSLGVILYELLTGQRPYRGRRLSVQELENAICEEEPQPTSTRIRTPSEPVVIATGLAGPDEFAACRGTDVRGLRRLLRGDLDMIALKALRKEPARRYTSVEQLSEDLRRHLEGLPVIARPDFFSYRARKFIRRNRAPVALAAGFFLAVSALAVITTAQSRRIAEQRNKALAAQEVAQKESTNAREQLTIASVTIGFQQRMLTAVNAEGASGGKMTMSEFLAKASKEAESSLSENLVVRASLQGAIGMAYHGLGMLAEARDRLEKAVADGRQYLKGRDHAGFAVTLANLAYVCGEMEDLEGAGRYWREVLDMRRRIFGEEGLPVAATLMGYSWVIWQQGDYSGAESLLRKALVIHQRVTNEEDDTLAQTLSQLGWLRYVQGDNVESVQLLNRSALVYQRIGKDSAPMARTMVGAVAKALDAKGDRAGAIAQYRKLLELQKAALGEDNVDIAETMDHMACLLDSENAQGPEAESLERKAIAIFVKVKGPESTNAANCKRVLGSLLARDGKLDEAESACREALSIHRKSRGNKHYSVVDDLQALAAVLSQRGDYTGAESNLREALATAREAEKVNLSVVQSLLRDLAYALSSQGKSDTAIESSREALGITRQIAGDESIATAFQMAELANELQSNDHCTEAEQLARDALAMHEKAGGPEDWVLAEIIGVLGDTLATELRWEEAEAMQRRSLAIIQKRGDQVRLGGSLSALGVTLVNLGDEEAAEEMLRSAIKSYEAIHAPVDCFFANAESGLGRCLMIQSRFKEAEPLLVHSHGILLQQFGASSDFTRQSARALLELYGARDEPQNAAEYLAMLARSPTTNPAAVATTQAALVPSEVSRAAAEPSR